MGELEGTWADSMGREREDGSLADGTGGRGRLRHGPDVRHEDKKDSQGR